MVPFTTSISSLINQLVMSLMNQPTRAHSSIELGLDLQLFWRFGRKFEKKKGRRAEPSKLMMADGGSSSRSTFKVTGPTSSANEETLLGRWWPVPTRENIWSIIRKEALLAGTKHPICKGNKVWFNQIWWHQIEGNGVPEKNEEQRAATWRKWYQSCAPRCC